MKYSRLGEVGKQLLSSGDDLKSWLSFLSIPIESLSSNPDRQLPGIWMRKEFQKNTEL